MQGKKQSSQQIQTNRKGSGSRMGTQQNQQQNNQPQINTSINSIKQRDQSLFSIVKQYLQKSGYTRTAQTFKTQKPVKRILPALSGKQIYGGSGGGTDQKSIINLFEKGNRDQFFKLSDKMFSSIANNNSSQQFSHALRKLQFQLNIYFCIYNIHPMTQGSNKKSQIDKQSSQAFKKYIDTKGQQIAQQAQLLAFFALPYIPRPQDNPTMSKVFTKQWLQKLKANLQQNLRQYNTRNTANSNKQNKKSNQISSLHQIYDRHMENSVSQSRIKQQQQVVDHKVIQKYQRQSQQLKMHNKEMVSYLQIMQQNLKDLNEASRTNLVQSNRKWFQFSKQILQLTKKALKGQNVKQNLQRYQRFFGTSIDQLIYCSNDISLFQKNSYTQDASMLPKNAYNINNVSNYNNNNQSHPSLPPIDYTKILTLFSKSSQQQLQMQLCLVLKALKDRLCYHKNAYTRRQVVVSYQRNDICGLKESNNWIQKKLLFDGGERVRQFYLRLMNYISTDDLGNQYLSQSEKLIQNLMGIMGTTSQQTPYRKHAIGILQKLSYLKQSQLTMISFGIIPMIFKIFRNQSQTLTQTSIQYLMGLIMNLAVRKQSIINFQKHKSQVLPILLKFIDVDDNQVKGYVNGTLYVLLQLESIKRQAIDKYKIKELLKNLLQKSTARLGSLDQDQEYQPENCLVRQYSYILQRLQEVSNNNSDSTNPINNDGYADDQDQDLDDNYVQDIDEDIQMFSEGDQMNQSQYIQGQDNLVTGQELLMKKYALLGPQAVRQQIINRSILDQTGRKSNNMTTSINHSKRIDKVFHKSDKSEAPSPLLPNNLDLSINPTK